MKALNCKVDIDNEPEIDKLRNTPTLTEAALLPEKAISGRPSRSKSSTAIPRIFIFPPTDTVIEEPKLNIVLPGVVVLRKIEIIPLLGGGSLKRPKIISFRPSPSMSSI